MDGYTPSLEKVIQAFSRFPGIGAKSAEKLAFYILKSDSTYVENLCDALLSLKNNTKFCETCFNITETSKCQICLDPQRNQRIICVVEHFKDAISIEKTHEFKGLYHILMGHLSPIDGVGPDDIKIPELIKRIKSSDIEEVILATNPNIEGDATALYIANLLKPFSIKVTRIARGLPIGGDLEYADPVTLSSSLAKRELL